MSLFSKTIPGMCMQYMYKIYLCSCMLIMKIGCNDCSGV